MSVELYVGYLVACVLVAVIPGPTVALVVANSLTHGTRAGLLNVAGTQLALALMIGVLVVGLAQLIETMGWWFDWVRLAGAAYLVWIGWKLITSSGRIERGEAAPRPRGGFFLQGFLVMLSNPKVLLFFGAFIPQFVDASGDHVWQVTLLGITAMLVAVLSDSAYAVLTGRAGALLARHRVRLLSRLGGACLIGGGIWLAFSRAR
jgi:homoserine/homoserine lactone efflux protein